MHEAVLTGLPIEQSPKAKIGHDLTRFDRRRKVREAVSEQDKIEAKARARVRAKARQKAAARSHGVSVFAVTGFMLVGFMFIMVIFSYVRLTEVSNETAKLKSQLKTLKTEEVTLMGEYEHALNLENISIQAETVYGMTKPEREQIVYLDLSKPDYAEVLTDDKMKGIRENLEKTGENFSSFLAYFK